MNCRVVEEQILPTSAVAEILNENYIEARIHTDHDQLGEKHRAMQMEMVGLVAAPYYVILDPATGAKLAEYKIAAASELNDNSKMLEFLQGGLD